MHLNIFEPFFKNCGLVILDGAMATELEKKGADLNHALWSAKLLIENPGLIKQVHMDYLESGADIITTASYQASFSGFEKQGYSRQDAKELLTLATTLALEARSEFLTLRTTDRPAPLVAASVGPYGASLADGSEYRGDYERSVDELMEFHRERFGVLYHSGADLFAFETIPCYEEAAAIIELLKEFPDAKAWISFSCRNEKEVCGRQSFADCAALVNDADQVVAVGVNCTAPQYVETLVKIAVAVTNKPVIAYPNRGEVYDPENKNWLPGTIECDFTKEAVRWAAAGAQLIGGCCRTSPEDIRKLRNELCTTK